MAENDVSDRYVLRRIHKSHFHPGASLEIDPAAFRPSKDDHDGLSVSFENEISADDLAAFARQPAENYGVVRFGIAELEQLGLTIQRHGRRRSCGTRFHSGDKHERLCVKPRIEAKAERPRISVGPAGEQGHRPPSNKRRWLRQAG
jgi:hypothetical protein